MSNLFVVFILFLSGILCFKVDYLIVSVLFSIFCLFHIIKKKLSKKYLIVCLLFVLFGLFRILLTQIPYKPLSITGLVIKKSDQMLTIFNGFKKFVVFAKDHGIKEWDIVTIEGNYSKIEFSTIEGGFNYVEYLNNQGITELFYANKIKVNFQSVINLSRYKEYILGLFPNKDNKLIVSGILFGENDYQSEIYSATKRLNLILLFSISGLYLNFISNCLRKFFMLFVSEKIAYRITFLMMTPLFIINLSSFAVKNYLLSYFLNQINNKKGKYFSRIDIISLSGLIMLFVNPFFAFQTGFQLSNIIKISFNYSTLLFKKFNKVQSFLLKRIVLILCLLPFYIKNNSGVNFVLFLLQFVLMPLFKFIFLLLFLALFSIKIPFSDWLLTNTSNLLKRLDFGTFSINLESFSTIIVVFYYIIIFFIFYFLEDSNKKRTKQMVIIGCLCFSFYSIPITNFYTF